MSDLKQMTHTMVLPKGISDAQTAFLVFCEEVGEIDATAFTCGTDFTNTLHGLSVQNNGQGIIQVQSSFFFSYSEYHNSNDYIEGHNLGGFNSSDKSFFSQYVRERNDNSPFSSYIDRKIPYNFIASFDKNATIRSVEILCGVRSNDRIFSIHIGDKKFLISGSWYDREGFHELAFQHSTVEQPRILDVTVVSSILKSLNVE